MPKSRESSGSTSTNPSVPESKDDIAKQQFIRLLGRLLAERWVQMSLHSGQQCTDSPNCEEVVEIGLRTKKSARRRSKRRVNSLA